MKKYIVFFCLIFMAACSQPPPPQVMVSLVASPLMQGAKTSIHVQVSNPGKSKWQSIKLLIGYSTENDTSVIQINEIPLSLVAGQVFEQDIPWKVDFQPKEGVKYQLRAMILTSQGTQLAETSIPIEFAKPALGFGTSPLRVTRNTQTTITIQVTNPSGTNMEDYTLELGYAPENDPSFYHIAELPLSLAAGQEYKHDVQWNADFQPSPGVQYQLRLMLISPENVSLAETSAPIELVEPELTLAIIPVQLKRNTKATINVQMSNPGGSSWQDYTLSISYGAENDTSSYLIKEIPFSLNAGETFNQDIPLTVDYIPTSGNYVLYARILLPDNVLFAETKTPITLSGQ